MTEKKKLKVKIFDREYSLLVENQEIAAELAEYVNSIMEETRDELPDQPKDTIAIIAALNIAYDLFVEKNRFREFSIQATDKVKKIKLLLSESKLMSTSQQFYRTAGSLYERTNKLYNPRVIDSRRVLQASLRFVGDPIGTVEVKSVGQFPTFRAYSSLPI